MRARLGTSRAGCVIVATALVTTLCSAQTLAPIDSSALTLSASPLTVRRGAERGQPFTVAGSRGLIVGEQAGTFEQWVLPVKVLSHMTLEAELDGYSVPIDLNAAAREIEVSPEQTVITYTHIGFTLRQIMFAPEDAPEGTGAVVLFQIDSTRPLTLTLRFKPELRPMWPERGKGTASPEWVARGSSGFYVIHSDYADFSAAVALPDATSGILAPYQEKPQTHPLEFHLRYDPSRDGAHLFPLLVGVGESVETASTTALEAKLGDLNGRISALYGANVARYASIQKTFTVLETPDHRLDDAFRWAIVSIEQLRARSRSGETALVAGYFDSGDSARPGFGWYFGRDAYYTLSAVNGFGDFGLSRQELDFLIARQSPEGKMMHEYSQTAAASDWNSFPYLYASADATPLFLTSMLDYVTQSGDAAFLKEHREAVLKAWKFETTHDADGDGIYDNAQGTGWVESWPPGMPKQEIYLALLDQQASAAMGHLADMLGSAAIAQAARARATRLHSLIEREYFDAGKEAYAFSSNGAAGVDRTATIYPALAWWNGAAGLDHPETSLRRWNTHDFATDWGLRDVAESDPLYDPISYHQGSVWPLFTGWASLAEYRGGHPIAGFAHLLENANQTFTQDLGAVTELLSGAYFTPFGRSTSHQLWSSAMVITPALRGLFGLQVDGGKSTLAVDPHLPAAWPVAALRGVHVGAATTDVEFRRENGKLRTTLTHLAGGKLRLAGSPGMEVAADGLSATIPLPAVEVGFRPELPLAGARTAQAKVVAETRTGNSLTLLVEGQGGSTFHMDLRRNASVPRLAVGGASLQLRGELDDLAIVFPAGSGYQQQAVTLRW